MTITNKLLAVQQSLKAPKEQMNDYGGYKYRSCEDILELVKPLLKKEGLILTLSDDVRQVGEYAFIKATATLSDGKDSIVTTACARDSITRKGMDASQITGAASSYARKYALNGLFCIDDTKDADATNTHDNPMEEEVPHDVPETPKDAALEGKRKRMVGKLKETFSGDSEAVADWLKEHKLHSVKGATDEQLTEIEEALK